MSIAPKGFRFATVCAGFRKEGRADLALLVSDVPAVAAGTFTQNRFPAAPVLVAKAMLAGRPAARAVVSKCLFPTHMEAAPLAQPHAGHNSFSRLCRCFVYSYLKLFK